MSFLISLAILAGNAFAQEPAERPVRNTSGLANVPLAAIAWDDKGCPTFQTSGFQYVSPERAKVYMEAISAARAQCEAAEAEHAAHEAELVTAKAAATSAILLADAGATAVRTAAQQGADTYVDADAGVAATGGAAPLAAYSANGNGTVAPYAPLGTLGYNQAAWALTRPPVPVAAPPPAAQKTATAAPPPAASKPDPAPQAKVEYSDKKAAEIAASVGIDLK